MEFSNPSRFLSDIDSRYLNLPQGEAIARKVDEGATRFRQSNLFSVSREEREERYIDRHTPSMFDGGEIPQEPHRFVKPTPPRTLRKIPTAGTSVSSSASTHGVSVGQTIEHERFGLGEVIRVEGTGDNCKATVRFRNVGEKQLLLKFARFKVVNQ